MKLYEIKVDEDIYDLLIKNRKEEDDNDVLRRMLGIGKKVEKVEKVEKPYDAEKVYYDMYGEKKPTNENWKIEGYYDISLEVDAKRGKFGTDNWKLRLKKGDQEIIADFGPSGTMKGLSDKIRGIEDYYAREMGKNDDFNFNDDRAKMANLWLEIGKAAKEIGINISSECALIKSENINVKGMNVIPKPWGNPIKDGIIVSFCNFWIGWYYPDPNNRTGDEQLYFRLSSYDSRRFGRGNAKYATEYINLDPISDRETILKILENAIIIYAPDITLSYGLRSL